MYEKTNIKFVSMPVYARPLGTGHYFSAGCATKWPIFEVNSRTVLIFLPMLIFIFDFFFRLVRAVAYRWLIRWICGHMGWDNTRPLPACVYHKIRGAFPTAQVRGYQAAEQRD